MFHTESVTYIKKFGESCTCKKYLQSDSVLSGLKTNILHVVWVKNKLQEEARGNLVTSTTAPVLVIFEKNMPAYNF